MEREVPRVACPGRIADIRSMGADIALRSALARGLWRRIESDGGNAGRARRPGGRPLEPPAGHEVATLREARIRVRAGDTEQSA